MKLKIKKIFLLLFFVIMFSNVVLSRKTVARVTPFGQRVNSSIDLGLQWLRNNQSNEGGWGRATGLSVLCFLENRISVDWNSPSQGYSNMEPADQERVKAGLRYCIEAIGGFKSDTIAEAYDTSACMMAISAYLSSGGPIDVNASISVDTAALNGVNSLKNLQRDSLGFGFKYNLGHNNGNTDMSTTQFGMAGLYSAERIVPQASSQLSFARDFIRQVTNNDGGGGYRPGYQSSHAMSASLIWTRLLSGQSPDDLEVQQSLRWLQNNYTTNHLITSSYTNSWANSHYYYLWASAKALEVSIGNTAGLLYSDQIGGVTIPADVGYPEESPRWYFDYAWFLINDQKPNGSWCGNGIPCWNSFSATSYALLVLMRSLGGVCLLDEDNDDLCAQEDNCPEIPNPDQIDRDNDGVGDACDNCIAVPNISQIDEDNDNIGDACDPIICVITNEIDICDGIDNDCDGAVDEEAINQEGSNNTICPTGLPGICSAGISLCINGEYTCMPNNSPSTEFCDRLDNDCDGLIDEELTNACGYCNLLPEETCDNIDNDCDGIVDEDETNNLCGEFKVCYDGECRSHCGIECSDSGTLCDLETGLCLPACHESRCEFGLTCNSNNTSFWCEDLCEGIICNTSENDNLRCWEGECVPDLCIYTGCESGSVCDGVECIPDVCNTITCDSNHYCRGGQCIPSCANISCPLYESCIDGACQPDACGGVICENENQICLEGLCVNNPCENIDCLESQECINGICIWSGCQDIVCPPGQECETNIRGAQCKISEEVLASVSNDLDAGIRLDMNNNENYNSRDFGLDAIEESTQRGESISSCSQNRGNRFNLSFLLLLIYFYLLKKYLNKSKN